jgi:sugar/nucleoside kinase (ribokinase family)
MDAFDGGGTASVLKKAKENGLSTSLDTAWDASGRWWEIVAPMFDYIDIFLPSADEAKMLSGEDNVREMARFFLSKGVNIVGIKQGADGGYFRSGSEEIILPALEVDVIDTTGCGDAFCAGFLAGYFDGLSLKKCGRMAVTLGSLCATGIGATCKLPTREQLGNTLEGLGND